MRKPAAPPVKVRKDIDEARRQHGRGESGVLTREQLRRWTETGEWPDE